MFFYILGNIIEIFLVCCFFVDKVEYISLIFLGYFKVYLVKCYYECWVIGGKLFILLGYFFFYKWDVMDILLGFLEF